MEGCWCFTRQGQVFMRLWYAEGKRNREGNKRREGEERTVTTCKEFALAGIWIDMMVVLEQGRGRG